MTGPLPILGGTPITTRFNGRRDLPLPIKPTD